MIETVLKPFDWVIQMPIESQCRYSIGLSLAGFLVAAFLREYCTDRHIRLTARALGAGAFFAVAAFAVHATKQVDKLEAELFVKKGNTISAETAVTVTSKKGNTIHIGETNGLRRIANELRQHDGSIRFGSGEHCTGSGRFAAGSVGGNGSDGRGYDGVVDARRMLKQSGWWNAGDAGRIQRFGKAEEQTF